MPEIYTTYIRMCYGFVYLASIMDWFSRYVLSWEPSISLDTVFCVQAPENALQDARPEIFNVDQGAHFTSTDFTSRLKNVNIQISMGGLDWVYDNIFVERLWGTIKYEEVYLHDYRTVSEARYCLADYFHCYNTEMIHEALGYRTLYGVYSGIPFNPNHVHAYPTSTLNKPFYCLDNGERFRYVL